MPLLENEEVWALLVLQDLTVLRVQLVQLASRVLLEHRGLQVLPEQ